MATTARTVAIIPNFNGKHFLRPCIDALLSQAPSPPDIIVVDNGSSDGSSDFIKVNYPGVRLISMDRNAGFGAAVNRGIRDSAHEFIALVNNDATVRPGWLAALEKSLDGNPAAAAAPKVIFDDGRNIFDSAGDCVTPYGFVYKRGHFQPDTGQYDRPEEVFSVSAVATLFRRSLFNTIGLFDENFFAYYEDIDLCLRGRLAGFRFLYEPAAVTLHHYSATSGSKVKLGTEEVYIHLTGIWIKNIPAPILIRRFPSIFIFHSAILAGVALARLRKKSRLPRVPVVKFLASMARQRREIQRRASVSPRDLEKLMARENVFHALCSRILKAVRK